MPRRAARAVRDGGQCKAKELHVKRVNDKFSFGFREFEELQRVPINQAAGFGPDRRLEFGDKIQAWTASPVDVLVNRLTSHSHATRQFGLRPPAFVERLLEFRGESFVQDHVHASHSMQGGGLVYPTCVVLRTIRETKGL